MREIKFRAWDKVNKRMVTIDNVIEFLSSKKNRVVEDTSLCCSIYDENEWNCAYSILSLFSYFQNIINNENLEVMQYTGLKDKNGVEIYEGDIVKSDWGFNGVVDFESFIYAKCECTISDNIEVIGNIYDNPEFLEKGE